MSNTISTKGLIQLDIQQNTMCKILKLIGEKFGSFRLEHISK